MALTVGTGARGRRVIVEVFTREGCHLCEQAEALVAAEAGRESIRHIDVDTDEDLKRRYGDRVPVIVVDGRLVAETIVDPGLVTHAVARSREERWADWRLA